MAGTGVPGLDDILAGGLQRGRVYLIEGSPGTGKTTIATQFLLAGAEAGERGLYITLSETEDELRASAASHGWTLDGIDSFSSWSRRKACSTKTSSRACSIRPTSSSARRPSGSSRRSRRRSRNASSLDSLSEIRLLAQSSLRYRRQILALKHYFARSGATVLMLDDLTSDSARQDGAQRCARRHPARGAGARLWRGAAAAARRSNIAASASAAAIHDFVIETGGVRVFPRLVSAEHRRSISSARRCRPHSPELNALLGGGVERGSSMLMLGPAGTGKSLLALTFVVRRDQARRESGDVRLRRGTRAAVRAREGARHRPRRRMVDSGNLIIEQIDAAELTPGEFVAARPPLRRGACTRARS